MRPIGGLTSPWDFVPSPLAGEIRWKRALFPYIYARRRPSHSVLKPLSARDRWIVYFVFTPDGRIGAHHTFTLQRLKDLGWGLFVICATQSVSRVPAELTAYADALYWKDLPGYDFSAYTLALEALSQHSSGATVFVLNDSMFGPFTDLNKFVSASPWEFTGFTASRLNENHIQSYAFAIRNVTPDRLGDLRDVLHARKAYNDVDAVIWCQETCLARVAARSMSVGAYVYNDGKSINDPCLHMPFEMLDAGFPFMKRSLLGKMAHFQNTERVIHYLEANGHPIPAFGK